MPKNNAEQIAALTARLDELATEVVELKEQLATEVRTRWIVVVEEDGFERVIVGAGAGGEGGVSVYARPHAGNEAHYTGVQLSAEEDESWDGGGVAGLHFMGNGNIRSASSSGAPWRTSTRRTSKSGHRRTRTASASTTRA